MKSITLQDMLKAGVHFGHQTAKWHPRMKPYLFDSRSGIHIIDLRKTQEALQKALDFIAAEVKKGKVILFVGTKRQAQKIVAAAAQSCSMPYVSERWLGGTFTNFGNIHRQVKKLLDLEQQKEAGELEKKYTKKEQVVIKKEMDRLNRSFGGLRNLNKMPDMIFVVDIKNDKIAVHEANNMNVPIIALCDSNADPETVNYPIPSNDDAIKVIELMCQAVAKTVKENYQKAPVIQTNNTKKETIKG